MINLDPVENAFSDPAIPSFETVQSQIADDYGIPHQSRMDMVSAINRLEHWFGMPLAMIPASAHFLRHKFNNFHPAQAGTSERRVQNVRSLILRAMRTTGLTTNLAPYQSPMSEEWQSLYDSLPSRYEKAALSRFMRYCSKQGFLPSGVDDSITSAFLAALEKESLVKQPRELHQTACRVWNKLVGREIGWPQVVLTVPNYENRIYAIADDLIHPDLHVEIEGYMRFLTGSELFDGLAKSFRPNSIKATLGNIRRYLSALHHSGFDVWILRSFKDMVKFAVFKQAMKWFWDRNGGKTSNHIGQIAWTIRCIAVKHLDCDEETVCEYQKAMATLKVQQLGLSEKNTASLAQFDDPKAVSRFLNYPDALFDKAAKSAGPKSRLLAQAGAATLILIFAPMRITNLNHLRIDQNLNWIDNRLHIHVPGSQVKNGMELNFALPQGPSDRIQEYIDRYRPGFQLESNPYLFPGRKGPKDQSALSKLITNNLFRHTGIRLTPHQFRHVAAKLLLDARPGHYEVVRKLLGHKNLSTVYESYSGAETQAAVDLYDEVIFDRKRGRSGKQKVNEGEPFLDPFNPFLKGSRR